MREVFGKREHLYFIEAKAGICSKTGIWGLFVTVLDKFYLMQSVSSFNVHKDFLDCLIKLKMCGAPFPEIPTQCGLEVLFFVMATTSSTK